MRLIDVDTLDDYLGKWADDFYENPENSDADFMDGYCMTLNRIHSGAVPEVDAVPIEWLRSKYPLHGVYGTEDYFRKAHFIHRLIEEWETEGSDNDEQHERSKIVHCKDCEHWETFNGFQGMCTKYYGLGNFDSDFCSMAREKDT